MHLRYDNNWETLQRHWLKKTVKNADLNGCMYNALSLLRNKKYISASYKVVAS
jgi:hypothetical protein